MSQKQQLIDQVIDAWQALQQQTPLVQCITNSVANNYVANILLAAGASPAMIDNPFEACFKHQYWNANNRTNSSDADFSQNGTTAPSSLGT